MTVFVKNSVRSVSVKMQMARHVYDVVVNLMDGTVLCTGSQHGEQVQSILC